MKISNEDLVEAIQRGENEADNLEKLYLNNTGIIENIARKYTVYAEIDDLRQEGFLGLREAAFRYKPDKGAFTTYLTIWVKCAMLSYVYKNVSAHIPREQRRRILKLETARADFEKQYGHAPNLSELAGVLALPVKEIEKLSVQAEIIQFDSINKELSDDGSGTLLDVIKAPENPIEKLEDKIWNEQLARVLWALVDDLKPKQAEALHRYYEKNESLSEISDAMGVSPSHTRTLCINGCNTLRHSEAAKRLEPFYQDILTAEAWHGTGFQSFQRTGTSSPERVVIMLDEMQKMSKHKRGCS